MSTYTLILQSCPAEAQGTVASFLGKAFSLKEATCANIVGSAPIILLEDLSLEQAAALNLALRNLEVAGAEIVITTTADDSLPNIEWPKMPPIYKMSLNSYVDRYRVPLTTPDGQQFILLDCLIQEIQNGAGRSTSSAYIPIEAPEEIAQPAQQATPSGPPIKSSGPPIKETTLHSVANITEFSGADMPEITPFSTPALGSAPATSSISAPAQADNDDSGGNNIDDQLGALFGDDGLGDDDSGALGALGNIDDAIEGPSSDPATTAQPKSRRITADLNMAEQGTGGKSVFLNKVTDAEKLKKAIKIIIDITGKSEEEVEKLCKRPVIPVVKGVSQEEADEIKHRFSEIKCLARIK